MLVRNTNPGQYRCVIFQAQGISVSQRPRLRRPTRITVRSAWEQRKLGEVATFGGGHTPSMANPDNYDGGTIPWVTSQDVKVTRLYDTTTHITERAANELTVYPVGTLVIVVRSGILRHTLPVAELRKPAAVNQDIKAVCPGAGLDGRWLMQYLLRQNKSLLLEFGKTGTTVESIDFEKMKEMDLPLPSLSEQHAIGALFSRLDSLITLHQREAARNHARRQRPET